MCVHHWCSDSSNPLKTWTPDLLILMWCVCLQGLHKARRRTPRTTVSETSHKAKASARQVITVRVCKPQTPAEQHSAFSPGLHPEHCSSEPQSVRLQQQSCSTQEGLDQSSPAPVTPPVSHSETNQDLDLWLDLILQDSPESTISE